MTSDQRRDYARRAVLTEAIETATRWGMPETAQAFRRERDEHDAETSRRAGKPAPDAGCPTLPPLEAVFARQLDRLRASGTGPGRASNTTAYTHRYSVTGQ